MLGPSVKVSTDVDSAPDAVVLADRPVLLESRGAFDGGLVGTCRLQDLVGAVIDIDGTDDLCGRAGVVVAESLNDVVFDLKFNQ